MLLFLWFVFLWKKHKSITEKFEIAFGIVIFLSEFMMDKSGTIQIAGLTVVQYAALLLTVLGIRTAYQRINHTIAVVNID